INVNETDTIINFILYIIIYSIIYYAVGTHTTTSKENIIDSPAYEAGLKPGDTIIKVNNKNTKTWMSVVDEISSSEADKSMDISVTRNGEKKNVSLTPTFDKEEERVVIGIVPVTEKGFFKSIKGGFEKTITILQLMFQFLGMLFRGEVTSEHLSGPVGVIHTVGEAAKYGFINLLAIMGFISVNLG